MPLFEGHVGQNNGGHGGVADAERRKMHFHTGHLPCDLAHVTLDPESCPDNQDCE